jgi:hypothetical protein
MNMSTEEFKRRLRSKHRNIKVYQDDRGMWRVCWFGDYGGGFYTALSVGKGYHNWEKAIKIAIKSHGKNSFDYAFLVGRLIDLENANVPTTQR